MKIKNQIEIYQANDGTTQINVQFEQDTVWLTQAQMGELFETTPQNITMHLKSIFKDEDSAAYYIINCCIRWINFFRSTNARWNL